MKPINFAQSNLTLNAPDNWDEEANGPCDSLPVLALPGTTSSVWRPSPEELQILNEGGAIILHLGIDLKHSAHPVVALSATEMTPETEEEVKARVAAMEAERDRLDALARDADEVARNANAAAAAREKEEAAELGLDQDGDEPYEEVTPSVDEVVDLPMGAKPLEGDAHADIDKEPVTGTIH
jgi:hypothetical protein